MFDFGELGTSVSSIMPLAERAAGREALERPCSSGSSPYWWGPNPWMIEAAAILSVFVRHWTDFGIILALLVMNAGVGFWEEFQAGNAIEALRARLALRARVKRDGTWATVPARELVPGDLLPCASATG